MAAQFFTVLFVVPVGRSSDLQINSSPPIRPPPKQWECMTLDMDAVQISVCSSATFIVHTSASVTLCLLSLLDAAVTSR